MAKILALAIWCFILSSAVGKSPMPEFAKNNLIAVDRTNSRIGDPAYRLDTSVIPVHYDIELTPHFEATVNRAAFTFDGTTTIQILVQGEGLTQIVLHEKLSGILTSVVRDADGTVVALDTINPVEFDATYEFIKINLAQALIANATYYLEFTYIGTINDFTGTGFYRGYYFVDNVARFYATTQFQPYHARKAFPCFDEPAFKATFTITINRPVNFTPSLSNMAIDSTNEVWDELNNVTLISETFHVTPLMSTYLLAYTVSDFVLAEESTNTNIPLNIYSRPSATMDAGWALEAAVDITQWMNNYFDFNYYSVAPNMKNDHIALPDFSAGAMENWGMVHYREAYLLYNENETNLPYYTFIGTIISHELAHKWFGNLVTCFWWSNLWLNESFASFFEYFATHGVAPQLELDQQFVADYVQSALLADSGAGAPPMNDESVSSPAEIMGHFGTTSYAKGASVLRMSEHLVGASTFQKALRLYLHENAFGMGTAEAMYNAFRRAAAEDNSLAAYPNLDIGAALQSWVDQAGYPVLEVYVDMSGSSITISQERFLLTNATSTNLWQVPITFAVGSNPVWNNTKPSHVLTTATTTIDRGSSGHEWVLLNVARSGYYRVNYDDHSWQMISAALVNNPEAIHHLNRQMIVDDVFAFMRSGRMSIPEGFHNLRFLASETNYYVWNPAVTGINWFRRRLIHLPDSLAAFDSYILGQMQTVINSVGFVESPTDSTSVKLNRMQILNLACELGHAECVDWAVSSFLALIHDNVPVPVNLRRPVFCLGVRATSSDRSDYDLLWDRYYNSNNAADQVVMLRGLGCIRNETVITHYLTQSIFNDHVRAHDRNSLYTFALQGNADMIDAILPWTQRNWDSMRIQYGGSAELGVALSNLALYLSTEDHLNELQSWIYTIPEDLPVEYADIVMGSITAARANLQWSASQVDDIQAAIETQTSAGANVVASFALLLTTTTVFFFKYMY